jgi:hypothetical protein
MPMRSWACFSRSVSALSSADGSGSPAIVGISLGTVTKRPKSDLRALPLPLTPAGAAADAALAARRADAEAHDVAVVVHGFDDDWFGEVAGEAEAAADGGVGDPWRIVRTPAGREEN